MKRGLLQTRLLLPLALLSSLAAALAGCAGSPAAISADPARQGVSVNGTEYIVAPIPGGLWGVTRRYTPLVMAGAEMLPEKISMTKAVEAVTHCRVVDSLYEWPTLHAKVQCP